MPERLFSLSEAIALLPTASRLLKEIQSAKAAFESAGARLEGLLGSATGNGHLQVDLQAARSGAREAGERLEGLLAELDQLGIELKGLDEGLLDFPSEREGRVVYLCWRQGEPTISFWHEIEAGFSGRQPL